MILFPGASTFSCKTLTKRGRTIGLWKELEITDEIENYHLAINKDGLSLSQMDGLAQAFTSSFWRYVNHDKHIGRVYHLAIASKTVLFCFYDEFSHSQRNESKKWLLSWWSSLAKVFSQCSQFIPLMREERKLLISLSWNLNKNDWASMTLTGVFLLVSSYSSLLLRYSHARPWPHWQWIQRKITCCCQETRTKWLQLPGPG